MQLLILGLDWPGLLHITVSACARCAPFGFSGQPCVRALCNLLSPLFLQQSFSYLPHLGILTLISSAGWPLRLLFPLACPLPPLLRLLPTPSLLSTSLPTVLSTAMSSFPEHNPEQASQAEPTIEQIQKWDANGLLNWIRENRRNLLQDDDHEKLKRVRVDGVLFLKHAGDKKYFQEECNLASGTSERLADLARELAGGETAGMVSTGKSTPRHASHADVHCPRWLRHTATPNIRTLHFHFYKS